MDRFIERCSQAAPSACKYLKSNMDRFIGTSAFGTSSSSLDLKSNMDRFIGHYQRLC